MGNKNYSLLETRRRKLMYFWIHMFVLLLSLFLIVDISIDTFKNIAFYREPQFMQIDLWICIMFLADFFLEWILSERKGRYLATHFLFFLVAIPYTQIIYYFGWTFPPKEAYLIRYIPLVRGGYALAMVVNWLTLNKAGCQPARKHLLECAVVGCDGYDYCRIQYHSGHRDRESAFGASRRVGDDAVSDIYGICDKSDSGATAEGLDHGGRQLSA